MKNVIYIYLFTSLLFTQCEKQDTENYSPEIKLIEMTPTTVREYSDSIVFTLEYEDKDGNIGFPDADINSLWIKDSRLADPDAYFLAPLGPLDTALHIKGEYKINLKNTFKLGNSPTEKTTFQIWLEDRKGNKSNVETSPVLTITD